MERLTNVEKLEKARKLADRGRYGEAMELVREMDVSKIRVLTDLSAIADIYEANGYTEEAYQTLRRIYEKTRTRRVLYQLAILSVKRKDAAEAELYYREFLVAAPEDPDQYVLRFLIDRLEQKEYAAQITSLEKLKEYEYVEEWAYELAKLYQKAGMNEKCIRECQDIELWFGNGAIVEKAVRLRKNLIGEQTSEEALPEETVEEEPLPEIILPESEPEVPEVFETAAEPGTAEDSGAAEEPGTPEEPEVAEEEPEQLEFHFDEEINWGLPEPQAGSEPVEEPLPENKEILEKPEDTLVKAAAELLQEDDYILTAEQFGWLKQFAEDIRKQYKKEKKQKEQMLERTRQVIDRAERRNMKRLPDIVNESSYRDSGLLQLTKEDFQIDRE